MGRLVGRPFLFPGEKSKEMAHGKVQRALNKTNTTASFWSEVQQAYETGSETVAKLCQRHGLTPKQLYRHAKTANWQMRTQRKQKKKSNKSRQIHAAACEHRGQNKTPEEQQGIKASQPSQTQTLREALEFITMDLMHHIQQRCHESQQQDQHYEREARTLSSLVRTYEKLLTLETESAAPPPMKELSDQTKTDKTADGRRRELAARLEKLIKGL